MIQQVLNEDCDDCTECEIEDAETVIDFTRKKYPQEWASIYRKYKD